MARAGLADEASITEVDDLHAAFRALGNPERLAIVDALSRSRDGMSVSHVSAQVDQPRLVASRHLKRLRQAGIVTARWERQTHLHWLNADIIERIEDWVCETLPAPQ